MNILRRFAILSVVLARACCLLAKSASRMAVAALFALGGGGALGFGLSAEAGQSQLVIEQPLGTPRVGSTSVIGWGSGPVETTAPEGLTGVLSVSAGTVHSVALKTDGTIVAWGYNYDGQTNVPVGLADVQAISAGYYHTLALKNDGTIVAWGGNGNGRTAVPVGLSGVQAVAGGGYHSVALKSDGTVVAWGYNNSGQTTVPAGLTGVQAISAGEYNTVALKSNGTVVAWGGNGSGQSNVPAGLTGVQAIAAGTFHTLALKSDGTVVAWGYNAYGETNVPAGLTSVRAIAAGSYHSVALKSDGTVVSWGYNAYGQATVPAGLSGVQAIATGYYYSLAVKTVAPVVDFGSQAFRSGNASRLFTLTNTGTTALSIASVAIVGGVLGEFGVDLTGMVTNLPAGSQTTLTVAFTPSAIGRRTATLRVISNDSVTPTYDLALTGTGTDSTFPVIAAHANVGPIEAIGVTGSNVSYAAATATDDSGVVPTITYSQKSGTFFPVGVTTVIITATDASGNAATSSFTVTVRDTHAPTIITPANVTAEATSFAGSNVTYPAPTATDAVDPAPVVVSLPPSGSMFPIGTTKVNVTATDKSGNPRTSSFTVTVRDTLAPVLHLPANLTVGAASGSGSVVKFNPTAADAADPAPVLVLVPASGSIFPIGITTVYVTVTDASGNRSNGTFKVTVRDTVAPSLTLTHPRLNQSFMGGEVFFRGQATDDRAVARVEVILNGGTPQVTTPESGIQVFNWSLVTVPENGLNTAVVTAYDLSNNPSPSVTRTFNFVNVRAGFAGSYHGLLSATESSWRPIEQEGLVSVTVLSNGTFTGKVTMSGTRFPITGVFLNDGRARFGQTGTATMELIKGAVIEPILPGPISPTRDEAPAPVSLGELTLTLDTMEGAERITGTLTQGGAVVAVLDHADRALYTAQKNAVLPLMNVPEGLLDPHSEKGYYTALFLAGAEPNNGVSDFPRGDGWAKVHVAPGGAVRLVGKLADGSIVSYGNALSKDNELAIFVLLYANTGLLTGSLVFDPTPIKTDASGAGLRWYKRRHGSDRLYPNGWPEAISLDLVASKFVNHPAASGLNALSIAGVTTPAVNAVVTLEDGLLPAPTSNDASVALNSKSTILAATNGLTGVEGLKLSIVHPTGAISGSFTHPGTGKAVFSGMVYQKTQTAAGFFLYFPPKRLNQAGQSGASGGLSVFAVPGPQDFDSQRK